MVGILPVSRWICGGQIGRNTHGKYVRILCGMMAVLVAATALGLWQLAEAPQYVAAAESRGQAKPVSFGTDTALVPVHLESQTQEEQLVLRVLAADTEEPVRGALFVVELIDGDGQKTVCKDWDLDGVITTEPCRRGTIRPTCGRWRAF